MLRVIFALIFCVSVSYGAVIKAIPLSQVSFDSPLPGEASITYIGLSAGDAFIDQDSTPPVMAVRIPSAIDVTGVVAYMKDEDEDNVYRVTFSLSAAIITAAPDGEEIYHKLSRDYVDYFITHTGADSGHIIPGTKDRGAQAWWHFRNRGFTAATNDEEPEENNRRNQRNDGLLDLFSGTTALHENLQFDRRVRVSDGIPTVPVTKLPRITTRPVAWDKLLPDQAAAASIDLLAAHVPGDQYALFVRSFAALQTITEQGDSLLAGPLQLGMGRAEDAGLLKRYQKQLGLELNEISKRLGGQVIEAVAITGSDPFLRMGSDVGVLLYAKQVQVLNAYLTVRRNAMVAAGAKLESGIAGTLAWQGAVSADRSMSSYVLIDGDVVLVTNSKVQLDAYAALRAKKRTALAEEPEMRFFRHRYNLNNKDELALAVISDATIRRWCDADNRIGDALRQRAAMRLANLQTEWIYAGCPANWQPTGDNTDLGVMSVDARGVRSSSYGSLHFMTPIAELGITKVTEEEAGSYRRFLRNYERSWRGALDPIALCISSRPNNGMAFDLSVLPLAVGSDYQDIINMVGNTRISFTDGDAHDSLLHVVFALDPDSEMAKKINNVSSAPLGGLAKPLSWLGTHVSLYVDDDPVWDEILKAAKELDESEIFEKFWSRLPLAVHVSVRNPLGLTTFMTAARAFIDQMVPNMLKWETVQHGELSYVRITPTPDGLRSIGMENAQPQILYLAAPEGLTFTFSDAVIKHVIERIEKRRANAAANSEKSESPVANQQAVLTITPRLLRALDFLSNFDLGSNPPSYQSYDTAAILNEWHKLFPDPDPVVLHELWWGVKPVCPLGGTYRWNEHWMTMESSANSWGDKNVSVAEPKTPGYEIVMRTISSAQIGISFEKLPDPPRDPELQPGERRVTVLEGDTWDSIASQEWVGRQQLLVRNKAKAEDPLEPGRVLIVPSMRRDRGQDIGLRVQVEIKPAVEKPASDAAEKPEKNIP